MKMKPVIEINNLSYSYDNSEPTLKNIQLKVAEGEFIALVGQNGAGKTTLVKHLIGLIKPKQGEVKVCGCDVKNTRISQLAKQVGFVFQNPDHQIFHDTVEKEVAFGLKNLGLPKEDINALVTNALKSVGLEQQADMYPPKLSRGQRQRVALASVLAMKPQVIILDEPTTGQDYQERQQIMELVGELNSQGHTVIFITHDMSLVAQYARRVIILSRGRVILDGPTRQVLSQNRYLAESLLEAPQITLLASSLSEIKVIPDTQAILTVEEMYTCLQRLREGN